MAVKLAKCPRCSKIFSRGPTTPVCVNCMPDEEADYDRVREVLSKSGNLNPEQVAHEAGVSLSCVKRLLDDGRISSSSDAEAHKCGRCGAPAISKDKRLCEGCLHELDMQTAEHMRTMQEKLRGIKPSKISFKTSDAKKPGMAALERHQVGPDRDESKRMAIRDRIDKK